MNPDIKRRSLTGFANDGIHFRPDFFDNILNPARMNSAVADQSFQGNSRNFSPDRIKTGQNNRLGRVIHNEVDSRRCLNGPDISAFPADDPSLHLIAGQVHH